MVLRVNRTIDQNSGESAVQRRVERHSRTSASNGRPLSSKRGWLSATLFWRVFAVNAALLITAAVLLALSPATVSFPIQWQQGAVLAAGLGVVLLANAALLRISLAPLRSLVQLMHRIDLLVPGDRLPAEGAAEVRAVGVAFNEMLERLELERRSNSSRVVAGQEEERRQIARDLHDQVGQGLTALLLLLKKIGEESPPPLAARLKDAQEVTRTNLEEVRRIARQLRPSVLDDLGLPYALHSLLDVFERSAQLRIVRRIALEIPQLNPAAELAFWRVAQEALTNVVRHAGAATVEVQLCALKQRYVQLSITDDGRGMVYAADLVGGGIPGMRERALAVNARLSINTRPGGGTTVLLLAPAAA